MSRTCLQDCLASVGALPPLRGIPPERRRVLFIDHDEPEVQEKGKGWGADTFQSKVSQGRLPEVQEKGKGWGGHFPIKGEKGAA